MTERETAKKTVTIYGERVTLGDAFKIISDHDAKASRSQSFSDTGCRARDLFRASDGTASRHSY